MRQHFYVFATLSLALTGLLTWFWPPGAVLLAVALGLTALGVYDILQVRHTVLRNFPVAGHGRWLMEWLRPMLYQYFIESDTDGVPISRMFRSLVYARAKADEDTTPLGTKMDTYQIGYEWMDHSMNALRASDLDLDPRVRVGGPACTQPYACSIFNISAMSFGALSRHAIQALNAGAQLGGFAHNTGEGGLSPYHLEAGGDLVWQIGTAYFGCRSADGSFSLEAFREGAAAPSVKMIEVKLSQGAKPGHGGILPAHKNTPEIARIRGVAPYTQVDSPPTHSAFSTPLEMMAFLGQLREASGGKPVGFKLCVGRKGEVVALCKAMVDSGISPDFITVDGGEGGTGAAPLEYSNAVGVPLREGLAFVLDCLNGFGLRDQVRVIAAGRVFSAFHMVRLFAIGADICCSARAMMLSLGCIQSLECNRNTCPTGIATQNPALYEGLVVEDKARRVANFHRETLHAAMHLIASSGLRDMDGLTRAHVHRRVSAEHTRRYDELFPEMPSGVLLKPPYPPSFEAFMAQSRADTFETFVAVQPAT